MSSAFVARDTTLAPPQTPAGQASRRLSRKQLAFAGVALAALGGVAWYGDAWWTTGRFIESTDDAYVGGNVTAIAPHVGGFVAELDVGDNQRVRVGQLLLRLDPRDFQAALAHATAAADAEGAALAGLRAQLARQLATIRQQEADVAAQSAQLTFAGQDAERYRNLALTSAGSRQEAQRTQSLEQQARATAAAATAALDAGRQQVHVLEAQIAEAEARLAQARADVQTASLNLGYTEIRAPIDGTIGNRAAQVGAYAAAGSYLLSVIPVSGLWVDANFKEDQLSRMAEGDAATIAADVLPGHLFHGHVASVAPGTGAVFSVIPAENATGNFTKIVQRVPVRIVLDGDDAQRHLLRPGLSTTVGVDIRGTAQ
jgi:membrane fusion protein (multidrug efflux system)